MGAPLIVILLFLKKYVSYSAYMSAKEYGKLHFMLRNQFADIFLMFSHEFTLLTHSPYLGFPKVYKRLLEGLNKSSLSPSSRVIVRDGIKSAMRFPDTAATVLVKNETIGFLTNYANQVSTSASNKLPPFFVTFAKMIVKKTPFGSVMDYFNDLQKKR